MSEFYEKLEEGLKEALAHTQGKINLKSESIEIPEPPKTAGDPASEGLENQSASHKVYFD